MLSDLRQQFEVFSRQREQFELNRRDFVQIEVKMGITFALAAFDRSTEEGRQRNRKNARKAYDTAKYFLNKHPVEESSEQHSSLTEMTSLKNLLLQLGETFAE